MYCYTCTITLPKDHTCTIGRAVQVHVQCRSLAWSIARSRFHYSCYSPSVLSFPSLSSTIHTYVQLSVGEYHIATCTKHCHCTMLFHTLWILTLQDSRVKAIILYVPKLIPRLHTYMYMYMYTETQHLVLTAHWWLSYISFSHSKYILLAMVHREMD